MKEGGVVGDEPHQARYRASYVSYGNDDRGCCSLGGCRSGDNNPSACYRKLTRVAGMKGCCVVSGSGKEMMVTIHEDPIYLFFEALKAGAAGYVLTDATRTELIGAVRKVLSGESLLTPELATRPLRKLASENNAEQAARALEPVW